MRYTSEIKLKSKYYLKQFTNVRSSDSECFCCFNVEYYTTDQLQISVSNIS